MRFSIKTLLILALFIAVLTAWYVDRTTLHRDLQMSEWLLEQSREELRIQALHEKFMKSEINSLQRKLDTVVKVDKQISARTVRDRYHHLPPSHLATS